MSITARLLRSLQWARLYPLLALMAARRVVVARHGTHDSMYPLLVAGDTLLCFDRLAFTVQPPRRGDVVLVEWSGLPAARMVKLVAGLPGEQVALAGDQLLIDGRALQFHQPVVPAGQSRWQLGPDQFFLLSYAALVGTDSRHFGPVPRAALRARAWRLVLPRGRAGPVTPVALDDSTDVTEPQQP